MRKDDAQLFIMKARVIAGWVEPEALEQLESEMAAETLAEEMDLTEEERALLALGELGKGGDAAADDEMEFDLDALAAEGDFAGGGDDAATEE